MLGGVARASTDVCLCSGIEWSSGSRKKRDVRPLGLALPTPRTALDQVGPEPLSNDTSCQGAFMMDLKKIAVVLHDLRTPLASIKASATSLLQRDVAWTPRRPRVPRDDRRGNRSTERLVGNLLDMSRLQTGAVDLVLREVGFEEVVPPPCMASARPSAQRRRRSAGDAAAGQGGCGAARTGGREHRRPTRALVAGRVRSASKPARSLTASTSGSSTMAPASRRNAERVFQPFQRSATIRTAPGSGSGSRSPGVRGGDGG